MVQYTRFPNGERPGPLSRDTPPKFSLSEQGSAELSALDTSKAQDRRPQHVASTTTKSSPQAKAGSLALLTIFLVSLVIPLRFFAGPLLLTPYRLFLLVMIIPLFFKWITGRAGKIYGTDFMFIGFVIWVAVALFAVHGTEQFEWIAITTVETLGAFLVGRVLVRTPQDFDRLLKFMWICMFTFLPAAILEANTGIRIFSSVADLIAQTSDWVYDGPNYVKRLGMYRAQLVFEHPILAGLFASAGFGFLYYTNRPDGKGIYGYQRAWVAVAVTFFSLSSGAFLALIVLMGMAFWDKIMKRVRHHWKVLLALITLAYVTVDLISNRTPFEVFISYGTFSAHNGYMRIHVFVYGMENVWAHPIIGLGMNDWARPDWLYTTSVDNFWLLIAMRHGIPGFILVLGAYLATILRLSSLKLDSSYVRNQRTGLVLVLVGLVFALMTVHIWGIVYIFVLFLLGAGSWMRDFAHNESQKRRL